MPVQNRILRDITEFIFVCDQPEKADIIFIPGGGWPQLSERAAELYCAGYAKLILPSGKFSYKAESFNGPAMGRERYGGLYSTEWEFEKDILMQNGVPEQDILREDRSRHTVDNAVFSKEALDGAGLSIDSAIICCKAYHARRCLMTYGWVFPGVRFIICPTDTQGISRENWHQTEHGRQKVLSELSKCSTYFADAVEIWSGME
jgi:uncharacterized SAM-binding protein YcdF (DUF218 family)